MGRADRPRDRSPTGAPFSEHPSRDRGSVVHRILDAHAPHLAAGLLRSSLTHLDGLAPVLGARPRSGAPGRQISRRSTDPRSPEWDFRTSAAVFADWSAGGRRDKTWRMPATE